MGLPREFYPKYCFVDDVNKVDSNKATEALQFYEDNAEIFQYTTAHQRYPNFNWDECRAVCSVATNPKHIRLNSSASVKVQSYSHSRFMEYVARYFGTTVSEMKNQWRNIKSHDDGFISKRKR